MNSLRVDGIFVTTGLLTERAWFPEGGTIENVKRAVAAIV
jgi:hypothetical protein